MNLYKQQQIQEARLKIKKNLQWAVFFFVLSLAYTILGWQVMMDIYEGVLTIMFMVLFFIPAIPFFIYLSIGFILWCTTWQFIENAANAKIELNFLLLISHL